ncbi:MAG: hypothetical protein WCV88_01415 [Patescibacteria group bacterium]|jgi:hypothetical protein
MLLITILKYVLPITIAFDAIVSIILIAKGRWNKTILWFSIALSSMVIWEIFFWFSQYTDHGIYGNNFIDRVEFLFGYLIMFSTLGFLVNYSETKVLPWIKMIGFIVLVLVCMMIPIIGVGSRLYVGSKYHNYIIESNSWGMMFYYGAFAVMITLALYLLFFRVVKSGTSKLENARQSLVRNSLLFSLLATLCTIIIPLIFGIIWPDKLYLLGSDQFVSVLILSATITSVWTTTTAYAITRYRLFDITIRLRGQIILGFIISMLVIVLIAVSYLIQQFTNLFVVQAVVLFVIGVIDMVILLHFSHYLSKQSSLCFALPEHRPMDMSVEWLIQRIKLYLVDEFDIVTTDIFLFDSQNNTFFKVGDELVQVQPDDHMTNLLKNNTMLSIDAVSHKFMKQLNSNTQYILPLLNNDVSVGFVGVILPKITPNHKVDQGVTDAMRRFAGFLHQAMAVASVQYKK